jgi:YYY domain-containing protein
MEYGLVAVWWLTYVGLGLFGLPVAARLCASLPGRGAGFSLALSSVVMTLVAFWVGYLALGWVALLAGLAVLAVCAVLAVRGGVDIDRRAAVEALVVFTVVYLGVIAVRAVDPGITPQGEKFLDFGLMVSLYRSASLPPEDFWFAGKSIIYYYGGHFLASLLTRLTGTHPWYGFNLAMAGFYGMLASGAYELAGSVAVGRRSDEHGHTRLLAGVTALFFTMWASTLSTVARMVVQWLPAAIRTEAAKALASIHWSLFSASNVLASILGQDYQYKLAARIIPPETQNPFPLFAIVRGDMRPYVLSTPFLLCVAGLCYAYYRTPETAVRRRRALVFGAVPVIAGFMAIVNTWSFAIAFGLVWLTLSFSPASVRSLLPPGTRSDVDSFIGKPATDSPIGALARTVGAVPLTVVAAVVGVLVALPFFLGPFLAAPKTSLVALAAEARSPLGSLLLVHGAFLAVIIAYYLGYVRKRWSGPLAAAGLLWFGASVVLVPKTLAPLVLFAVPLAVGWVLLVTDRTNFEGVLIVAGLGLVLVAELVFVQDGNGRFNTVVKTYMPTWIFWASATGIVLPTLVRGRGPWSWSRHRQQVGAVLAALLVISTGVYGVVALQSHFADPHPEEPTLDGLAAAEQNIPGQVPAIQWLYNRTGRPTIVSAPGWYPYRWSASPAASLTGVPTVVGVSHEAQYRGRKTYLKRVRAVNTIYLGPDKRRAALLEKYNVEYIYVGPTERRRYGDIRPFSPLRGVSIAFQVGSVTIYAVNQTRLNASRDGQRAPAALTARPTESPAPRLRAPPRGRTPESGFRVPRARFRGGRGHGR